MDMSHLSLFITVSVWLTAIYSTISFVILFMQYDPAECEAPKEVAAIMVLSWVWIITGYLAG